MGTGDSWTPHKVPGVVGTGVVFKGPDSWERGHGEQCRVGLPPWLLSRGRPRCLFYYFIFCRDLFPVQLSGEHSPSLTLPLAPYWDKAAHRTARAGHPDPPMHPHWHKPWYEHDCLLCPLCVLWHQNIPACQHVKIHTVFSWPCKFPLNNLAYCFVDFPICIFILAGERKLIHKKWIYFKTHSLSFDFVHSLCINKWFSWAVPVNAVSGAVHVHISENTSCAFPAFRLLPFLLFVRIICNFKVKSTGGSLMARFFVNPH